MGKRAGRPRQPAPSRQPNGRRTEPTRLQRQEAATAVVKRQRLARGATNENYTDQAHESPLGRLYVSGGLGRGETAQDRYQTGLWFRGLYTRYTRAIEAKKPYLGTPGGGPAHDIDEDATRRTVARYTEAIQTVPVLSRSALMNVVICQNFETEGPAPVAPGTVVALIPALDALTAHRVAGGTH